MEQVSLFSLLKPNQKQDETKAGMQMAVFLKMHVLPHKNTIFLATLERSSLLCKNTTV